MYLNKTVFLDLEERHTEKGAEFGILMQYNITVQHTCLGRLRKSFQATQN
jgi:hypothetical protein